MSEVCPVFLPEKMAAFRNEKNDKQLEWLAEFLLGGWQFSETDADDYHA